MNTKMLPIYTFFYLIAIFLPFEAWSQSCSRHADCDDGVFCNGTELCLDTLCVAGDPPCVEGQICSETYLRCQSDCPNPDVDGDGALAIRCGGNDCDDNDPNTFPGNTEVCDAYGHDEDCDPRTVGSRDSDGDGYIDSACKNDLR